MGEGLYMWQRTSPGPGWRLVCVQEGYKWKNKLWFRKAMP